MRLANRRILITGGASGIGLESAKTFVREGARVALLDRDASGLEAAGLQLEQAVCVQTDVSEQEEVEAAVTRAAAELGGLDGVLNVAGIGTRASFDDTTAAMFMNDIRINLLGPFLVSKAAVPHLRRAGGGTIVNVASGLALRPMPGKVAYGASKGGLIVMTKAMAIDLAKDGIRVNVVCPGYVDTPLVRSAANGPVPNAEQLEAILDRRILRRVGEASEIADALLFLTSNESTFITASVLAVDGGGAMH